MGGIKKVFGSIGKLLGGGGESVKVPQVPDYEAERKSAEDAALRKRGQLAGKGMSGTVLGGAYGQETNVAKKKLLGE